MAPMIRGDLTVQTQGRQESNQNEALPWAFTVVGGAPTFDHVLAQHINDAGSVYVHEGSAAAFLDSEFRSAVFVEEQSPVMLAGSSVKGVVMVNANEAPLSSSAEALIAGDATVTLAGNTSCDNGQDLVVGTSATPTIDDTNTFCDGGPEGS